MVPLFWFMNLVSHRFATLNRITHYSTQDLLYPEIGAYVTYYNEECIHSSLDYQTPDEKAATFTIRIAA